MKTLIILLAFCVNLHAGDYATFYHDKYEGRETANGDIFYQFKLTCASNKFPFGTLLRVTYKEKHIDVRVNDRMKRKQKSTIDLSREAFKAICPLDSGIIPVTIQIIRR